MDQPTHGGVVETLGALRPYETAAVRLDDGTALTGRAFPVVYVPGDRLRLELRCEDRPNVRFELRSDYADGWGPVRVRQCRFGNADWQATGEAVAARRVDGGASAV